jgi:23S rRNA (cytosine1962-C5)-methyltransferase
LVRKGGMLLACCNAASLPGKKFKEDVRKGIRFGGRKTVKSFDALQPPDFPATANEPAYLKVSWLRLD